tara:strand:+ start:217 stop:408 length:192 start_codon:yes stop_codon:yes gene_type:complete
MDSEEKRKKEEYEKWKEEVSGPQPFWLKYIPEIPENKFTIPLVLIIFTILYVLIFVGPFTLCC